MDKCPYCGNEEFYRKGRVTGYAIVHERFDGANGDDNSNMYDHVQLHLGKTRWCNNCYRKLPRQKQDEQKGSEATNE